MPEPYPRQFRDDVIAVARRREPGVTLTQIARDFAISESCLNLWLKAADVQAGVKPGAAAGGRRRPQAQNRLVAAPSLGR